MFLRGFDLTDDHYGIPTRVRGTGVVSQWASNEPRRIVVTEITDDG